MSRIFLLVVILGLIPSDLRAQNAEQEVENAVHALFDAMRNQDGETTERLFHPQARLQSVVEENAGRTSVANSDVDAFVRAIGTPRTELWDERIWDLEIRVDGGLAIAWMNYAFFVDDQLSHCGVNSFQFVQDGNGWQVMQIIDTRRRTGCEVPM